MNGIIVALLMAVNVHSVNAAVENYTVREKPAIERESKQKKAEQKKKKKKLVKKKRRKKKMQNHGKMGSRETDLGIWAIAKGEAVKDGTFKVTDFYIKKWIDIAWEGAGLPMGCAATEWLMEFKNLPGAATADDPSKRH